MLITHTLKFTKVLDPDVEDKIKFPLFVPAFYRFIYQNNRIPNQDDFYDFYLQYNDVHFKENTYSDYIMSALNSRVRRMFPSLVRDIHFALYVKENLPDVKVLYNENLDVKEGVDLCLISDDKLIGVNLFTLTTRGIQKKSLKKYRHTPFENITYVDIPMNLDKGYKCGYYSLYREPELNLIKTFYEK